MRITTEASHAEGDRELGTAPTTSALGDVGLLGDSDHEVRSDQNENVECEPKNDWDEDFWSKPNFEKESSGWDGDWVGSDVGWGKNDWDDWLESGVAWTKTREWVETAWSDYGWDKWWWNDDSDGHWNEYNQRGCGNDHWHSCLGDASTPPLFGGKGRHESTSADDDEINLNENMLLDLFKKTSEGKDDEEGDERLSNNDKALVDNVQKSVMSGTLTTTLRQKFFRECPDVEKYKSLKSNADFGGEVRI